MEPRLRVLLDRCARREGVTHRSVLVQQSVPWGNIVVTAPVVERLRFAPRPDESFKIEQLPYLASIAVLARSKRIELCTSFELSVERLRNIEPDRGYVGFDLFEGTLMVDVPSPAPRAVSISAFGSKGIEENEQESFLRSITNRRFTEIRRLAGDKHVADAFHFWTAEANQLNTLLTTDRKFLNVYSNIRTKLDSRTTVLSPRDLCELLGMGATDIEHLARKHPSFA